MRLHNLDRAHLRRRPARLRWKSWNWFPAPAISGETGGNSGFTFPKAQSKTTQGSHYYVAYPQFEVAEDDADEGALRCAARMSSKHDLVEEFVGYGVWPLSHG
jgi:hypothetical protein